MVSLEPYILECKARSVPPAPAERRPVLSRLAQLALASGTIHSPPFHFSQQTCYVLESYTRGARPIFRLARSPARRALPTLTNPCIRRSRTGRTVQCSRALHSTREDPDASARRMEAFRSGRTVHQRTTIAPHATRGGRTSEPRPGGPRAPAQRSCYTRSARVRMRRRSCAPCTSAYARGGAAALRSSVVREHRGARARRAAVPMLALVALTRCRLLARAFSCDARACSFGMCRTPLHRYA